MFKSIPKWHVVVHNIISMHKLVKFWLITRDIFSKHTNICMYVCMYACMHACIYKRNICMYACAYVYSKTSTTCFFLRDFMDLAKSLKQQASKQALEFFEKNIQIKRRQQSQGLHYIVVTCLLIAMTCDFLSRPFSLLEIE